jgi:hypothetical protein
VNNIWLLLLNDPPQRADTQRVRHRRVMSTARRIQPGNAHGSGAEPVNPDPGGQDLLILDPNHALRRHTNLVPALCEGVGKIEDVELLAPDVWWKELR